MKGVMNAPPAARHSRNATTYTL